MEGIRVELGERSYNIFIDSNILAGLGERLKRFELSGRCVVVSNPTVFGLHGGLVINSLEKAGFDAKVVLIPDGEEYKELLWVYYIYGELLKYRLDRKSALIALGGGVIGDITGFAASTYMRGISFIQIPTTLLAQADSSVGGKTGVNHPLGKNMMGTFYQPRLVWTDVETLKTLPGNEFAAGMAEIIKYGVIWDEGFFGFLEQNRSRILELEADALGYIIRRSCEIKAEVVSRDETEAGLRAILNYGHTIGHAIETVTGYTRFLHGEAVAIGMNIEARLASMLGILDKKSADRIRSLINAYKLPAGMPSDVDARKIISAMQLDKKAVEGRLKFILPEKIGSVRAEYVADAGRMAESLRPD